MTVRVRVFTIGCIVIGACSASGLLDPTSIDPPVLSAAILCARQDSLIAAVGAVPTFDQNFAILARLLPGGFGGLYSGGMFLVSPERLPDTRAAAATLQRCSGRHASSLSSVQQLRVLRAKYDWIQLITWKDRIDTDASRSGTFSSNTFTDIDETQNRIAVEVLSDSAKQRVLGRLRPLNIPTAAVEITVRTFPPP